MKQSIRRFITALGGCVLLFCGLAMPVSASGFSAPFDPECEAAYIVNLDTNIIVYAKNERQPMSAASLTKLVTAALTLNTYYPDLDTPQLKAKSYLFDYVYGKGGSTADIRQNEILSPRQLLYAMMLPSANEAAYVLAAGITGDSVDNFVYMMNAFVSGIGCTDTVFYDPCGLDGRNVTTARDAYLILRYILMSDYADEFAEICQAESFELPANVKHAAPYSIYNVNRMVCPSLGGDFYRSYNQGGKTGSLEDWQNFAGWHTKDGESYISVVLHAPESADGYTYPTKRPALYVTNVLMDWVYDSFSLQPALDTDEPIIEVPVKYCSSADTVMLYPADTMLTVLPADSDGSVTKKTFDLPEALYAPIKQGDVVGTVTLSLSGRDIGTTELLVGQSLSRNPVLYGLQVVQSFFFSLYFRILLVLLALAAVGYVSLYIYLQNKKHNSDSVHRRRR